MADPGARVSGGGGAGGSIVVVKLGGSLCKAGRLAASVEVLARSQRPVVVVPGGGAFADTVRAQQGGLGLSDAQAHGLALLAMHQMALVLLAASERFVAVEYLPEVFVQRAGGPIPVWLPYALQHGDPTLPADWTVTSDALAARLAERLVTAQVVLVKSCVVPQQATIGELTALGIVDPVFGQVVERAGLVWRVVGAGEEAALAELVGAAGPRAERVLPRQP